MADNWYIILELEFDPVPVHDEAVIEERIIEKSRFWSSKMNTDPFDGPKFAIYHQKLPQIRKDMIGAQNIRARLVKEACEAVYAPIDKVVKRVGLKGEITKDELKKMAARFKVSVETVERRAGAFGIKIGEGKTADFQAIYDKYYKNRPQLANVYDGMIPDLKPFKVDNLYDFLGAGRNLSTSDLLDKAVKKRLTFQKHDAISGSGLMLCGQCEEAFKDKSSKTIYDAYLDYQQRKSILDEAKELSAIQSGRLSEENGNYSIGKLTAIFKDIKLAQEVFTAFCEVEGIFFSPIKEDGKAGKLVVCRCGSTNDVSSGRELCGACGLKLNIECPKCKTPNEARIKICKCGFDLENIDRSVALCELAQNDMSAMDFKAAKIHLSDAEKLWPGNAKIAPLRQMLTELKERIGDKPEKMRAAADEGRFHEAGKMYDDIKKLFSEFNEPELDSRIQGALAAAAEALNQAKAAKSERDIIDFCDKAYELCKDFPGIAEVMAKFPPQTPTRLNVVTDGIAKTNVISWDKSVTEGMVHYTIVRSKDIAPVSIGSGEVLGRISSCEFSDTKPEAAAKYFYAVFAERAGIRSKPLVNASPIMNFFEVSDLMAITGDSSMELKWGALPDGATAEIYRKKGAAKEERIHSTTAVSHLDGGLENDSSYTYVVRLVYNVDGKKHTTKGITVSGIPTRPPKPAEGLIIKPGDGDVFTATWSHPDDLNVELYSSMAKPKYNFGDVVPQQIIEGEMSKLALNRTSGTSATFKHKGDDVLYVIAAVIKSGSVVVGAAARASREETVKIQNVGVVNGKIHIYLEHVPKDASGFVVLHRFDRYPADVGETGIARKYITLKNYRHSNALIIDSAEPKNYYFAVYAAFDRDGERDYSIGANIPLANASKGTITYSVRVSKKKLGMFGSNSVTLGFEAENQNFHLPDIEILSSIGTAPMFRESAKHFHSIEAQTVKGSLQVEIPISSGIQRDTYIKPFLKDESQAQAYQLKLKLGTILKIS